MVHITRRGVLLHTPPDHSLLTSILAWPADVKAYCVCLYTTRCFDVLVVIQELPSRQVERALDAPDNSNLSPGAHGAAAASTLHQLPTGKMAVAPADVVNVTTAEELYDAVQGGIRDIQLTAHVDLSTQAADDLGFILPLLPSTRSIRVRPWHHCRCSVHSCACTPCTEARHRFF